MTSYRTWSKIFIDEDEDEDEGEDDIENRHGAAGDARPSLHTEKRFLAVSRGILQRLCPAGIESFLEDCAVYTSPRCLHCQASPIRASSVAGGRCAAGRDEAAAQVSKWGSRNHPARTPDASQSREKVAVTSYLVPRSDSLSCTSYLAPHACDIIDMAPTSGAETEQLTVPEA